MKALKANLSWFLFYYKFLKCTGREGLKFNFHFEIISPLKIVLLKNLSLRYDLQVFSFHWNFISFQKNFHFIEIHVLLWYPTCSIPNHSVNFKSCYAVMSISSRDRTHFRIYLWMVQHLGMIFDELIDIIVVNIFQAYFAWHESLAPKSRPVSVYRHAKINQKLIMMTQ